MVDGGKRRQRGGGGGGNHLPWVAALGLIAAAKWKQIWRRTEPDEGKRNELCPDGVERHGLSLRSKRACKPSLRYYEEFMEAMTDQYSAEDNPNGRIVLLIAENKLTVEMLCERFRELSSSPASSPPASAFCYDSFRGPMALRSAVAHYASETFAKSDKEWRVEAEDLSISAGCGAVLDNLCFCLSEPNDSVLIPAPYYPAFDNDLEVKAKVNPVAVLRSAGKSKGDEWDSGSLPTDSDLNRAESRCLSQSKSRSSILLITNPHNPTGTVIREDEVYRCIAWGLRKEGTHVVVDEIYANSIYREGEPFKSAIAMIPDLRRDFGEDVVDKRLHVVFGFSKDLCASGLRVGCLYTKNGELLSAIDNLGYFCGLSGYTAHLMTKLLEDNAFMAKFLRTNRERLNESYNLLTKWLVDIGIPFQPACAGMFVWINLQAHLKEKTFEGERALWSGLAKEAKVLFTPGEDCHAREPGYFRICFAWVPQETLEVGMRRVKQYLSN